MKSTPSYMTFFINYYLLPLLCCLNIHDITWFDLNQSKTSLVISWLTIFHIRLIITMQNIFFIVNLITKCTLLDVYHYMYFSGHVLKSHVNSKNSLKLILLFFLFKAFSFVIMQRWKIYSTVKPYCIEFKGTGDVTSKYSSPTLIRPLPPKKTTLMIRPDLRFNNKILLDFPSQERTLPPKVTRIIRH